MWNGSQEAHLSLDIVIYVSICYEIIHVMSFHCLMRGSLSFVEFFGLFEELDDFFL